MRTYLVVDAYGAQLGVVVGRDAGDAEERVADEYPHLDEYQLELAETDEDRGEDDDAPTGTFEPRWGNVS